MVYNYNCELIRPDGTLTTGVLAINHENREVFFDEKDEKEISSGYVVSPSFFNSHVHLGDSHIKDPLPMRLEELVGPGGFKFRYMKSKGVNAAMRSSIEVARSSGTSALADFREGGCDGLEMLREADKDQICYPLTRPSTVEEAESLAADDYVVGFGLSSTRDHEESYIEKIRKLARAKNKIFAIHAGERDDQDVDDAINLEPDMLVHMNMASKAQLRHAMNENIPIVSCLRSNSFFGLLNPENYQMLLDYDRWLIGTDNVMVASPSMLDELTFASYLLRNDVEVVKAAFRGFEVFGVRPDMVIFNKKGNLSHTLRPISSVVRRGKKEDIDEIISGYDLSDLFND
ncbi:MAG: amidohydrolase family protein [Archaeoglobaceae archaeon]